MEFKSLVMGVKIPAVGIGTWHRGGQLWPDTRHDKEEIEAIKAAIDLGMTHIDTAELYGNGHAEELVGEAIKGFNRRELFITTKVKDVNLKYDDLISSCKKSLQRLKTKYIDLYLIHSPNPSIPLEETMKAMDELVKQRFVRFIGVSNFSVNELKEAQKYAENKIVANQIEYNLLVRDHGQFAKKMESEIIPYCQTNNIMVIAYRPVAQGRLAKPGYPLLDELAKKYGKTQAQVAINWLISKRNVITIPKASKIEHLKENLGAVGWKLSPDDRERLDVEFKQSNYKSM